MKTPFHPLRRVSLATTGAVLAAAAVLCLVTNPARAQTRSTGAVLVDFKVQQKSGPVPSSADGPTLPALTGVGGSTSPPAMQSWLEITVSNVGESDISGLTINYHVFSKTSTIGKTASVTMDDALGSTSVNIPYGRSVTVSTPPTSTKISSGNMKAGTFNGGGAQTARKGKGSSGAGSSTVTDIVGWYVEAVTDNPNRPVKTYESPTGIVRQYETLQLQNGNN
jgi:hypothetical protein